MKFDTIFRKYVEKIQVSFKSGYLFIKSEIMWKNIAQRERTQMTTRRMRITFWIPKATNTHAMIV